MPSTNSVVREMNEADRLKKLTTKIVWPDGHMQEKLTGPQNWLNWEHLHRGHEAFYQDCYSCACEQAY